MKWLLIFIFLLGVGYAWFTQYEPRPSSSSMQGVIANFQDAVLAKDVNGMRVLCTGRAMDACDGLVEEIRAYEDRRGRQLSTIGSLGFDYTRGRSTVDGQISGYDTDGDMVFNRTVRVEQASDGGSWSITNL